MSRGADLIEKLLCLLFPAQCLACDRIISPGESFCESCKASLPGAPLYREFTVCGKSFRVTSLMPYKGGFRKSLHRLKFEDERALAKQIGRLMAEVLPNEAFSAVTWVPMSEKKKRLRGYDQSELLARTAARELDIPAVRLITKIRETDTQHELARADRIENIKNAYRAEKAAAGMSIILVDDIITTGSTLCECAGELYRAGATKIVGLCAADTPVTKLEEEAEQ